MSYVNGKNNILVSLKDVVKDYENDGSTTRILKGITLDIYRGEFLVVTGESGCGKTTTLNIIGGMDTLTGGSLVIDGADFSKAGEKELTLYRRESIGFVFQSYNLMPNLCAIDNVRFIAGFSKNPMDAEEALALVGLKEKAGLFPAHLSGGQQQRVAIARALVKRPKMILADEPVAALDYETGIEVLKAFETVVRTRQSTVVLVTHNREIGKMADRVVHIQNGKIHSIETNDAPVHAAELEW